MTILTLRSRSATTKLGRSSRRHAPMAAPARMTCTLVPLSFDSHHRYRLSYGRVHTAGETRRPDVRPWGGGSCSRVPVIDTCTGPPRKVLALLSPARTLCTRGATRTTGPGVWMSPHRGPVLISHQCLTHLSRNLWP